MMNEEQVSFQLFAEHHRRPGGMAGIFGKIGPYEYHFHGFKFN